MINPKTPLRCDYCNMPILRDDQVCDNMKNRRGWCVAKKTEQMATPPTPQPDKLDCGCTVTHGLRCPVHNAP